jgi:hypothetical protein
LTQNKAIHNGTYLQENEIQILNNEENVKYEEIENSLELEIQEDNFSSDIPRLEPNSLENSLNNLNDPDEAYLRSCLPILKRLSNRKNILARLKIQQEFDEKYSTNCNS